MRVAILAALLAAGCASHDGSADAGVPVWDASACPSCIPSGTFSGDLCQNPLPACTKAGSFHDCSVGSPLGPYCCTCEPDGKWLCNLYCPPLVGGASDGGARD